MSNKKNRGKERRDVGSMSPGGEKGSQGRAASPSNKEQALGDQSRRSDANQAKMRGGEGTSRDAGKNRE